MSSCTIEEAASSCNAIRFFSIICIQSFFSSYNFINEMYISLAGTLSFGCFLCLCIGDPFVSKSHCNLIFVWEQVYKNRDVAAQLVQRAERNGYKDIVLTVDAPMLGRREANIKNKQILSPLFFSNTNHYIPFTVGYKVLHVMVFMFLSCQQNRLDLKSYLKYDCNKFCRMIVPPLKNIEGLVSTEVDNVSEIV